MADRNGQRVGGVLGHGVSAELEQKLDSELQIDAAELQLEQQKLALDEQELGVKAEIASVASDMAERKLDASQEVEGIKLGREIAKDTDSD